MYNLDLLINTSHLCIFWPTSTTAISFNTISRFPTLVKSVITSQVVYPVTPLVIPPTILLKVNKLERAFLWSGSDRKSVV